MNVLVTAGPTREFLDPVRFLSNRSSGKMGYAMAEAAYQQGHDVTLISGPVALPVPSGVERVSVQSAAEMCAAVESCFPGCDVLIMVAAVADWRPVHRAKEKLKKTEMSSMLELERTTDILERVAPRKGERLLVGFAAETERMVEEAARKLNEKNLDLMVANNIAEADAGFEVETNRVLLLGRDGTTERLPLMTKTEVAARIMKWIEAKKASDCLK